MTGVGTRLRPRKGENMFEIERLWIENTEEGLITDIQTPCVSFSLTSDGQNIALKTAVVEINGWKITTDKQNGILYDGEPLQPLTTYEVTVTAENTLGEKAVKSACFQTGKMGLPWSAKWITDGEYKFKEKGTSPVPVTFRKDISLKGKVKKAVIYATAIGIYNLYLDGEKIGNRYFAPGFTSYASQLQYQTYDVTSMIQEDSCLTAVVAGGWAVGAFVFTRKNRITANRQALLLELCIEYENGEKELIATDESWQVSREGALRFAEFYDGEIYDATQNISVWRKASLERVKIQPKLLADYGVPVVAREIFKPISVRKAGEELIYDFGQNFAGVVRFTVEGKAGQQLVFRHAEILKKEGGLHTAFLRSAKCELRYTCKEGKQTYSPTMTYMGFRYLSVTGVEEKDIEVEGVALYSDLEENGSFTCSDSRINRLQQNIVWSGKSNFLDIPTDCPQRDERMGWTGDIALFAPTACYNFRMSKFLEKWLLDVKAEQGKGGGIPNTVPKQGYGFPATMPLKAIAFWGDACIFVPYAEYMARGDESILRRYYGVMKKYLKACLFWSGLLSFGKKKYLWTDLPAFQFGDWVAPDVPKMSQWQRRCKWTGTAAIARSARLLSEISAVLGEEKAAKEYAAIEKKAADAYVTYLTDGKGKLKEEFQTGYVLPLHFNMFPEEEREAAVENLVAMVKKNDYCIGTGFPGTPYILFALADNGKEEEAFKMLTNTKCPSWLYEVNAGATTIWERWDGLDEDGTCFIGEDGTGGMISYNHYAFGAVGDFLYRRVAGIEATSAGYKTFTVRPLVGGGITSATGKVQCAYGEISSSWTVTEGKITLDIQVPVSTTCKVFLGEKTYTVGSGKYRFEEKI